MASSPRTPEIFSDVTLIVDPTIFKDSDRVKAIVKGYKCNTTQSSHYKVHGSFEEIEDLFVRLSSLERHSSATQYGSQHNQQGQHSPVHLSPPQVGQYMSPHSARGQRSPPQYESPHSARGQRSPPQYESPHSARGQRSPPQYESQLCERGKRPPDHLSPPQVEPVEVAGKVMDYIQKKCSKELQMIEGNDVKLQVQKKPDKTVVTFQPHSPSTSSAWRAHFTRERFITFYQRIATDLTVVSLSYNASPQHQRLQTQFPELLFADCASKQTVTVTGPYVSIARFEDFLLNGASTQRKQKETQRVSEGASSVSPTYNDRQPGQEEPCAICMDAIKETERKTLPCKHSFCRDCVQRAFQFKPVCPTCGKLYGELTGTQPEGGTMKITELASSLPGYERYGTIVIQYYIPSGIQKEEHPSPGHQYQGVARTGYLPDSPEGRKVSGLLKRAFDQRLIFTIGRSTTSGRNNVVTWNDIHHKTSTSGGPTHYGYPDPDYLKRVQDELKVKGIQ